MLYRMATEADIAGMAEIRVREWGTREQWEQTISLYLAGLHHPRHALAARACYVALEDGRVVGFAAGHRTRRFGCDGELQWMNVLPEQRRTGVASELLRLVANWFVSQSAFRICVDVRPDNTAARAFYRRHGAEELNTHWLVWTDSRKISGNGPAY